jgi:hypothetical protein
LVNRIDTVALAVIKPFFTDEEDRLPADNQQTWWEIWLRVGLRDQFQAAAAALEIRLKLDDVIEFPEREVILAFSDLTSLGTLLTRGIRSLAAPEHGSFRKPLDCPRDISEAGPRAIHQLPPPKRS